jgi:gamma-glutamyltranspeptidase/glutathione hydrolase
VIVESKRLVRMNEVVAHEGMVTARHPLAGRIGAEVLREGGNAIDATIAMAFASGVVEPMMSGPGGGGWMTIAWQGGRHPTVVMFQSSAPRRARPDLYTLTPAFRADSQGFVGIQDDANLVGHQAVGVPGDVAGLTYAAEHYASLPLRRLVEPAIELAEGGFPVTWYLSLTMGLGMRLLRQFPATSREFLQDGAPYGVTREREILFRQPQLANTLRRIAADGADGFYKGPVARALTEEMARGGGLIDEQDLADYQPFETRPLVGSYRGFEVLGLPAPASGPFLLEALNILEGLELGTLGRESPRALHLAIEAMRHAHADRLAFLGDPRFEPVPEQGLISKEYAIQRRIAGDPIRHVEAQPGSPWLFQRDSQPVMPKPAIELVDSGHTTSITAVDRYGTAVALTQSLVSMWGSGVVVPGTGVLLNNAMTLFDPRPGMYNSIQAGKLPASSNAHTIVVCDGQPMAAIAAPGGRRILDTCTQVVLGLLEFGMGMQEAVDAPLVDTSEPGSTQIDERIPLEVRNELERMGHSLAVRERDFLPSHFARPAGILRDPLTGDLHGGADPYAEGGVVGY